MPLEIAEQQANGQPDGSTHKPQKLSSLLNEDPIVLRIERRIAVGILLAVAQVKRVYSRACDSNFLVFCLLKRLRLESTFTPMKMSCLLHEFGPEESHLGMDILFHLVSITKVIRDRIVHVLFWSIYRLVYTCIMAILVQ